MNRWLLVYCKPKQDTRAQENLMRQGFEVFRPTIDITLNKIGSRSTIKKESLFPRYLFINVNPEIKSIAPVLSTYGVSSFVRFGNNYATASDELIALIQRKAEEQSLLHEEQNIFKKGDSVYIDGYGFDNVEAIYQNPCGDARSLILINILGKKSRISVPIESLSKPFNRILSEPAI